MARKTRISSEFLNSFRRAQTQNSRKVNTRAIRKRFLIVCEGTKTEPHYFESIKKLLPRGIITLDILRTGTNTLNIIDIAIEKRDEESRKAKKCQVAREFDKVWAVFDKDSFSEERFNNAIFKAKENKINCAYSNEAFEIWYLLHFEYYNTAISRRQYGKLISQYIGFKYTKNSKNMYEILNREGDEERAINNAKNLYNQYDHFKPATENPSTTVYKLVEGLNQYINNK